ncbi:MAG: methyltransferase domain-containing protein [Micropruina sp.]|uniref:class I SAM-dependent methyltransferase n=1 Tax=Micropruina sp. TaxID=2737536 RepID=UPI0039E6689E
MNTSTLADALDWLAGDSRGPTLILGGTAASFAAGLRGRHRLTLVDRDRDTVSSLLRRAPSGLPLVAAAEALPLAPCSFDRVLLAQSFHTYAPGLALSEFARVLRPGGRLGIAYTVRDDSVPWVKRLVALARRYDPEAMRGDYGTESLQALEDSAYFPQLQTRSFRRWVPIDRPGLVAMVERTASARRLDDDARTALLEEVGALYDNSARVPEPLLLPYRVNCWLAEVDHTELTAPLDLPDDGLHIPL